MTVHQFHQDLTGRVPTKAQMAFYKKGSRVIPSTDQEDLTAGLILALWQVKEYGGPTYVLVPQRLEGVVLKGIQDLFRYCVRPRLGDEAAIQALKTAFSLLALSHRVFTCLEPTRWVAIGWEAEKVPDWFGARL